MMHFEIPVTFDNSLDIKIAIVSPYEDITMSNYRPFKNTIEYLCEKGPQIVVLDLSRVEYIDSIGFGSIVNFRKKLKDANGDMVLCGMSIRLRHIYDFLGLKSILPVKYNIEESINYFNYKTANPDDIIKSFKLNLERMKNSNQKN